MLVKFPGTENDSPLDLIQEEVDAKILMPNHTINKFLFQLRKVDESLNSTKSGSCVNSIQEKKKLVQKLTLRCEHLKQRNLVMEICEKSEDLSNSSPYLSDHDIAEQTRDIKALIDKFTQKHRPSNINMKFLRFAIKLLEKAKFHQKVLYFEKKTENAIPIEQQGSKEISLEDFSLAESLYELASTLYEKNIEKFNKFKENNFSPETQKEIYFHIHKCNFSLEHIKESMDLFPAISGILGYAHTLTDYYAGISPYPSKAEIEELFSTTMY